MRIKDKPATPIPSRLLGVVLLVGGGVFLGDFFWAVATYTPSITAAPLMTWSGLVAGMVIGAVLVGFGVAAVLHSTTQLQLTNRLNWDL